MQTLKSGAIFRHYKDKLYKIVGIALHSETLEELVVYEALYPNDTSALWVRPLKMFLETVEVGSYRGPRFRPEPTDG